MKKWAKSDEFCIYKGGQGLIFLEQSTPAKFVLGTFSLQLGYKRFYPVAHFTPTILAIFPRDKMALDVSQTTPWNFVVPGLSHCEAGMPRRGQAGRKGQYQ